MADVITWEAPPLSADDERLINAYLQVGRAVDQLPYTDDFERLFRMLGLPDSQAGRHDLFTRLLTLRKMGRLPRAVGVA